MSAKLRPEDLTSEERAILHRLWAASGPEISDDQITAALAELDAAEGKGEGRG